MIMEGKVENNGVIKISVKGRKKFQIEDGPIFVADVVEVYNQWSEAEQAYLGEDKNIKDFIGRQHGLKTFVETVMKNAGAVQEIDFAQAEDFITAVIAEVKVLKKSIHGRLYSPPSSEQTVLDATLLQKASSGTD